MKEIDLKKTTYRISDFLSWQRSESLILSPHFQRRHVWQPGAKSFLIDTIVRGLPIPVIILREQKSDLHTLEPKREVVDGQQRLRTIISFIEPNLLKDFKKERDTFQVKKIHNKEIAGRNFYDLDEKSQQRILDYEFSVHILPSYIDDREVLQIFSRMNSTGYSLKPQELRNARFFGLFKTTMYQIAAEQLNRWRDWHIFTDNNIARMEEVELVSEFAILMIHGLVARSQKILETIYKEKDEDFPECSEINRRIEIVLDSIDDKLGSYIALSPFNNKSLFHILFALIYEFQFGIGSSVSKKARPKPFSSTTVRSIVELGKKINEKSLPPKELEIITARQKNQEYIVTLFKYFKKEVTVA